jgi:uncharacterized membrane protein
MPFTTLAGHPLHPQLVGLPLGMFPFSFAMDLMHLATGKQSYADAAYYSMVGGYVTGLAAGAAGAADYLSIPSNTESKKVANVHGALNLGIMAMYGLNLVMRRNRSSGLLPTLLSALGTAGLVVSGWYGGELVYKLGMRVQPLMEGSDATEWKLPGDEKLASALEESVEQLTPSNGH